MIGSPNAGKPRQRGAKKQDLFSLHDIRHEYYKPRMQIRGCIERPEIAGVISDQNEIVLDGMVANGPVFPACLSEMRNMVGFKSRFLGFAREFDGQAFIDEKPHVAAASRRRTRTRRPLRRPRQGCLRGRPRSGCAPA